MGGSPQPSVKEDANEDPLFLDMSTLDIDFDAQSNGQSPISLEEEYFDMNFTNRSQDSLVRSPTPSGSELSDLSDADRVEGMDIEEDPDFISHNCGLFTEADDLENIEGNLKLFAMLTFMYLQVWHSAQRLTHFTISVLEDPHNPIEGLESMARTLPTLKCHLGVNPDTHITYFFLCPNCWK